METYSTYRLVFLITELVQRTMEAFSRVSSSKARPACSSMPFNNSKRRVMCNSFPYYAMAVDCLAFRWWRLLLRRRRYKCGTVRRWFVVASVCRCFLPLARGLVIFEHRVPSAALVNPCSAGNGDSCRFRRPEAVGCFQSAHQGSATHVSCDYSQLTDRLIT